MTEALSYIAIYLLIGWLFQQVEDATLSKETKALLEEGVRLSHDVWGTHAVGQLHWQALYAPVYRGVAILPA